LFPGAVLKRVKRAGSGCKSRSNAITASPKSRSFDEAVTAGKILTFLRGSPIRRVLRCAGDNLHPTLKIFVNRGWQ